MAVYEGDVVTAFSLAPLRAGWSELWTIRLDPIAHPLAQSQTNVGKRQGVSCSREVVWSQAGMHMAASISA